MGNYYYKGSSSCTRTLLEVIMSAFVTILFAYVILEANGVDAMWAFRQTIQLILAGLH